MVAYLNQSDIQYTRPVRTNSMPSHLGMNFSETKPSVALRTSPSTAKYFRTAFSSSGKAATMLAIVSCSPLM